MSYTLICIDMQHYFSASTKRQTLISCRNEIEKAKSDQANIIFVEYVGYGFTKPCLKNLTDGYSKAYVVRKIANNGEQEIKNLVKGFKLSASFKVMGVNTNACVLETVRGLRKEFPKSDISVISKACNGTNEWSHLEGLKSLKTIKNIQIL